ncbi:membrane protein insertion efficiency factor YidD [Paenibacillus sp. KACC 21273]|uniref:Putative membrane protein insertion efficiency factor n=1 Tax=Paenibacillus kyungheensis TaxID=1452732 RepID=A0AAX3LWZ7_9BACL|nr:MULTISPECIES: membrane protein insertion efficiency factor YidD [Paenibacillus]WCT54437.1 membrane protein insertion efficiency factor YidD [Paenibacillus kyungheensis]WDF52432.1 membrane protein insertion efficiency factor YidD [Paenibacillus sp. KACC 21273]
MKRKLSRRAVQAPIHVYRKFISPLKPPTCRFYPTCSQYALEAIDIHGVVKGVGLAARRIGKCHPFHPGGFDPVPPAKSKDTSSSVTNQEQQNA